MANALQEGFQRHPLLGLPRSDEGAERVAAVAGRHEVVRRVVAHVPVDMIHHEFVPPGPGAASSDPGHGLPAPVAWMRPVADALEEQGPVREHAPCRVRQRVPRRMDLASPQEGLRWSTRRLPEAAARTVPLLAPLRRVVWSKRPAACPTGAMVLQQPRVRVLSEPPPAPRGLPLGLGLLRYAARPAEACEGAEPAGLAARAELRPALFAPLHRPSIRYGRRTR